MDKEQIKALLEKMGKYVPVSIIEKYLKMPVNTLQKALSETEKRKLPKKWVKPLSDFVNFKQYLTMGQKKEVKVVDKNPEIEEVKENRKLSDFEIYQRKKLGLK